MSRPIICSQLNPRADAQSLRPVLFRTLAGIHTSTRSSSDPVKSGGATPMTVNRSLFTVIVEPITRASP